MNQNERLKISLLLLRIGVVITMSVWIADKFFRPEHTAAVFQKFYLLPGLGDTSAYIIGALQALLVIGFALGIKKRLTYGLVALAHGVSTFSSYFAYVTPFEKAHILFFAAWPMLAACLTLYLMREADTLFVVKKRTRQLRTANTGAALC